MKRLARSTGCLFGKEKSLFFVNKIRNTDTCVAAIAKRQYGLAVEKEKEADHNSNYKYNYYNDDNDDDMNDNDYCNQVQLPSISKLKAGYSRYVAENWCNMEKCNNINVNIKGGLSSAEIESYYTNGYLIVKNVFCSDNKSFTNLDLILNDINNYINLLIDFMDNYGLLTSNNALKYKNNYDVFEKLSVLINEEKELNEDIVIYFYKYCALALNDGLFNLYSNKLLHSIIGQLLQINDDSSNSSSCSDGSSNGEVGIHPQYNLRAKIACHEYGETPWHQDSGYMKPNVWNVHQLVSWIPLVDTNLKLSNGCMQVIREGHKYGNIGTHTVCHGNTWHVDLSPNVIQSECLNDIPYDPQFGHDMSYNYNNNNNNNNSSSFKYFNDYIDTIEINKGDVLFINNIIPHRSMPNLSKSMNTRWSLDLRWQNTKYPNGYDKECLSVKNLNKQVFNEWRSKSHSINHINSVNDIKFDKNIKPTIIGPWMKQWECKQMNRHLKRFYNL